MAKQHPKKLTIREAIERLEKEYPTGVELYYIDYRDCIEDPGAIEWLAQTGTPYDSEDITDWSDTVWGDEITFLLDEVFSEEEKEQIENDEELEWAIVDWLKENDTSDPIRDLVRNTPPHFFFYDTGIRVDPGTSAQDLAKKLNLPHRREIRVAIAMQELVEMNFYGGGLVLLWAEEPSQFYGELKGKYLNFSRGAHLAIMDRENGSGAITTIDTPVSIRFERGRLHSDRGVAGYSLTHAVYGGLSPSDYEAHWQLGDKPLSKGRIIPLRGKDGDKTLLGAEIKRLAEFDKDFKAGKCNFNDPRYNRHHNTYYRNDYPAGWKCKDCGRFWID